MNWFLMGCAGRFLDRPYALGVLVMIEVIDHHLGHQRFFTCAITCSDRPFDFFEIPMSKGKSDGTRDVLRLG